MSPFPQEKMYSTDSAKIFSIHITNVIGGVASECRRCALVAVKSESACVPCPAGHYMVGGTGVCKSCPPNTFIRAAQPVGKEACVECGPNTKRNKVRGTNYFHSVTLNNKDPIKTMTACKYSRLLDQLLTVVSANVSRHIYASQITFRS